MALAVATAAVFPYLNSLSNGFVFDDVPIVARDFRIRSLAGVPRLFASDWWGGKTRKSLLYRPLAQATLAFDAAVAGGGEASPGRLPDRMARPFHVSNVLWHALATVALFGAALALFARRSLALFSALLFAVHPVHTEAVDGIVGRAELLSATFAFLTLALSARALRTGLPSAMAMAAVALLCGLLSKESAIATPAIVLLLLACRPPSVARPAPRAVAILLLALLTSCIIYVSARMAVLGTLLGTATPPAGAIDVDNPLASSPALVRVLSVARLQGKVAALLLWPRTLSADYSFDQIPRVSVPDAASLLGIAMLAGLILAVVLLCRSRPEIAFGLGFAALAFLPTSNLPFPIGTIFGERLLYLPSAGICLAVAAAALALPAQKVAAALLAALVVLGAGRTLVRNRDFESNETLFRATAASSPRSVKALSAYADIQVDLGNAEEAVTLAEAALAIHPGYDGAHGPIARAYRDLARRAAGAEKRGALRAKAKEHAGRYLGIARTVIDDGSALAGATHLVGELCLDEGRAADALDQFQQCARARSDLSACQVGVSGALLQLSDREPDTARRIAGLYEAEAAARRAIALEPEERASHQALAEALWRLAKESAGTAARDLLAQAEDEARRAITLAAGPASDAGSPSSAGGGSAEAAQLGAILLDAGRLDEALSLYREGLSRSPDSVPCLVGVGSTTARLSEKEQDLEKRRSLVRQAIDALERALSIDPDSADAHFNLGLLYLRGEPDPEKAVLHFRAHLRLRPDAPQAVLERAAIADIESRHPAPR